MITCTVCGAQNSDLAVVCPRCKSYLQSKVDNLDLFQTTWQLLEAPRRAMHRIALARHKNFVVLLSAVMGTAVVFGVFWYKNLGPRFSHFLTLLATGFVAGPPLGLLITAYLGLTLVLAGRIFGGKGTFRNAFAVVAYGSLPVVLSFLLVFPIELALFGGYLFDNNPPPVVINPAAYLTLVFFDSAAVAWSCILLYHGARTLHGIGRGQAAVVMVMLLAAFLAVAFVTMARL